MHNKEVWYIYIYTYMAASGNVGATPQLSVWGIALNGVGIALNVLPPQHRPCFKTQHIYNVTLQCADAPGVCFACIVLRPSPGPQTVYMPAWDKFDALGYRFGYRSPMRFDGSPSPPFTTPK